MKKAVYKDSELTVHPAAEMMPEMSEEEYLELKESIKKDGLQESIVIFGDKIIDGRHRFRACMELGIGPRRRVLGDSFGTLRDPYEYVIATNLHRRHLSPSQKAMVADKLRDHYDAEAKERQRQAGGDHRKKAVQGNFPEPVAGQSRDKAGKAVGVDGSYVDRARKLKKASPELAKSVEKGDVTLNAANNLIKTVPKEKQKEVIKNVVKSENPKRAALAAVSEAKKEVQPKKVAAKVSGPSESNAAIAEMILAKSLADQKEIADLIPNYKFFSLKSK